MKNSCIVLEGGGLRGAFTGGVLEYFLEKELTFDRATFLFKLVFRKHPEFLETLLKRNEEYNKTPDFCEQINNTIFRMIRIVKDVGVILKIFKI